jgi:dihydropyrimidinase
MKRVEKFDLVIKGGILVHANGFTSGDIFIRGGVIQEIGKGDVSLSTNVIDASGKLILPGVIDAHLHPAYVDDFNSLSLSAAFGGVTTLIPFIRKGRESNLIDTLKYFREEGLIMFSILISRRTYKR